jgi:hypothetical protein
MRRSAAAAAGEPGGGGDGKQPDATAELRASFDTLLTELQENLAMKLIGWFLVLGAWWFMSYKLALKDKLTEDQRSTMYDTTLLCVAGVFLAARWTRDQFDAHRIGEHITKGNYSADRQYERARLLGSREWMMFSWIVLVYSSYRFWTKVTGMPVPWEDRIEVAAYLAVMSCGAVVLSKCTRDAETSRQMRKELGMDKDK